MTIKLVSTPSLIGKGEITEINLPDQLGIGSNVLGSFKLKNIGTAEAEFRILISPQWYSTKYSASGVLPIGSTLTASLGSGQIIMPDHDAVIIIEAQRLYEGSWVVDDTKSH